MDGKPFYVYILASARHGGLSLGVTDDLKRRVEEHRHSAATSAAGRSRERWLVHYEAFPDAASAVTREQQLKLWHRAWKLRLIEESNPEWRDLYPDLS